MAERHGFISHSTSAIVKMFRFKPSSRVQDTYHNLDQSNIYLNIETRKRLMLFIHMIDLNDERLHSCQ
jgi:hypothetical protein